MSTIQPSSRSDRQLDRQRMLHVGAPNVGDRKRFNQLVDEIFERRWFTNNGCVVQELESQLKDYLGVKHCIAVCNATVGLQLACHALDLSGQVIVPSFTFAATPHAAQWEGLTPIFADIDPKTHSISPESISEKITAETSAIMGVHVWGIPCDTEAIAQIASDHKLAVIYDAAHAFGSCHQGKMIGNFGNCEVFSFHATKFFNTFEGGAIATNDDELAERLQLMRNFGFAGMDEVIHLGTNAKMPEICAAMGLSLLPMLDEIQSANRYKHSLYQAHLETVDGIRFLTYDHVEKTNWQYVVIEIDAQRRGETRDQVMQRLHENNVRARRYFFPGCHRMEPYRSQPFNQDLVLPHTETACQQVICLPTGSDIDEQDIERVCNIIRQY
ncbi:DegT/DnrJ/EryC1/StrS family aminotransferase [Rhodopirellula sp. MGV]|uniref:DegT/DnrJ/EryC1/StrS family aminotransferase n=1 Tax=Rhodopirellula sp. MGV TaxID=2023130 RepID=UPI000B978D6E|nr:DegT/DnrJ/EryC1/StrS family aminotransferase [Rhodopirellula sp. MGV]OYP32363.1 dTDP-4-dehydro-6-deoxyglucose aminotransferase [Rhodopirellula sp. MGV]PNY35853.1 dTDP-4-dehydro-6-deoxyglucose aminotransferase [Rhodopirellula baltica]